jgi:hypothetical protein
MRGILSLDIVEINVGSSQKAFFILAAETAVKLLRLNNQSL